MQVVSLKLNNFRCFESLCLDFNNKIVLITGANGSGKTSILEALHYSCYLRSFKTYSPSELIKLSNNGFSITTNIAAPYSFDTLQVSLNNNKRFIKLNQQTITSLKELYSVYKIVTITEDDLKLIQEGPSFRRLFIDQIAAILDPSYSSLIYKYRRVLENRNALLVNYKDDLDSYNLWSSKLFDLTAYIQKTRKKILDSLNQEIQELTKSILGADYGIFINYEHANFDISSFSSFDEMIQHKPFLLKNEKSRKRSLFGAHLDDLKIIFQERSSRVYASRGQQKLIVFLLKIAQINYLNKFFCKDICKNQGVILIVDDFISDFDDIRCNLLIDLMSSAVSQLFITSPNNQYNSQHNNQHSQSALEQKLISIGAQVIRLNSSF